MIIVTQVYCILGFTLLMETVSASTAVDYSCLHWNNWKHNTNNNYSSIFKSFTDILSSSYISSSSRRQLTSTTTLTTGWKVTFKGIPIYYHNMTEADITKLNSRPQASSDFSSNSKTTATAGTYYQFGSDLGYSSTQCTKGYWPPGPDCPSPTDRSYVFPIKPAPENSTSKLFMP